MAKSMVERYEQLLRQDPTSSVFVELAKALLEKGDAARAIEVCAQGISHHPTSTVGRVLWGKALIHQGRPAQAMEQFDQAIAIEKDNPYAYNLIGEVLLQRGLYRSALPILRKAVALQPNDGRVKMWLEQAQQALSGGPAPVFVDLMGLEKPAQPEGDSEEERRSGEESVPAVAPMAAARLRAAALGEARPAKTGELAPLTPAELAKAKTSTEEHAPVEAAPSEPRPEPEPAAVPAGLDLGLMNLQAPKLALEVPSLELSLSDEDEARAPSSEAAAPGGEQAPGPEGDGASSDEPDLLASSAFARLATQQSATVGPSPDEADPLLASSEYQRLATQ
ncbi:MAG TPA: tetratricopeptide repeat protein, partial [Myxococcus sp.]|nr:tetratricopeptide repeat protein [Myxococcus sp.]